MQCAILTDDVLRDGDVVVTECRSFALFAHATHHAQRAVRTHAQATPQLGACAVQHFLQARDPPVLLLPHPWQAEKIGDMLVEIQGQFEGRGLLDTSTHIALLDRAAGHQQRVSELRHSWQRWADARAALEQARQTLDNAKAEEDWLRDAVEILDQLAPQTGEENGLMTERSRLANVSRIGEGIAKAEDALFGDSGAQNALGMAINAIEKAAKLGLGLKKPLFETANEIGMKKIVEELKKLSDKHGAFYEPDPLLLSMC